MSSQYLAKNSRGGVIVEYGILLSVLGLLASVLIPPLLDTVKQSFADIALMIDEEPGYTGPVDSSPDDPDDEAPVDESDDETPPTYDPDEETGGGGGGGSVPPTEDPDPEVDPETPDDGSTEQGEKVCFDGTSTARPAFYRDGGDTVVLSLGGDQIATYDSLRTFDNSEGKKVQAKKVKAIGSNSDIYLVKITNVKGAVEVMPGQIAQIIAPDGSVVISDMILAPEWESGLGAGDEYVIFSGYGYIMDVRSSMNGNNNYTHQDQIGHPNFGDNDGNFDFDTTGCNAPGF